MVSLKDVFVYNIRSKCTKANTHTHTHARGLMSFELGFGSLWIGMLTMYKCQQNASFETTTEQSQYFDKLLAIRLPFWATFRSQWMNQ